MTRRGGSVVAGFSGRSVVVRRIGMAVLIVLILVQLAVLYAPSAPGSPGGLPHLDKLVHIVVFAAPVAVGTVAGLPRWLLVVVSSAHAVISELIQGAALPGRAADPLDLLADLVGVAVGFGTGTLMSRRLAPATRIHDHRRRRV